MIAYHGKEKTYSQCVSYFVWLCCQPILKSQVVISKCLEYCLTLVAGPEIE